MNKIKKERLDNFLVAKGYFETRSKAQAAIMAGNILVNELKIDKPGTQIKNDSIIREIGKKLPYVSRGGLKLKKALETFTIEIKDKIFADIGASTGGFTDCALQNGAQKVYAIDVGYGQLAWKLRTDDRVVNMERTNARTLDENSLDDKIDIATIDVAFISLSKILPSVLKILAPNGCVIALIKPQFEAGKENVGKKGVVRDPKIHEEVINNVIEMALELGFFVSGLEYSPVKGPEGNIEYLVYLSRIEKEKFDHNLIKELVNNSHLNLDRK
jgi:23S rRNA (cytidine1920-2'-O)/16S rRNA (cytidine1409-2'-O)-methyltransferase